MEQPTGDQRSPSAAAATDTPLENVPAPGSALAWRILSIEDNAADFELIGLALASSGAQVEWRCIEDGDSFADGLDWQPDVILCDYDLPRFSPHEALRKLDWLGVSIPLVVVTRSIGEAAAVEVLRLGARDYVSKDHLATLKPVIERVLREERAERAARSNQKRLELAHERLRTLMARLLAVQENERKRLALELHDALGQGLTSVLLQLDAADRVPDPAVAREYRANAAVTVRQSLEQVRTLSFTLRPPQLDMLGLRGALLSGIDLMLRSISLRADLRVQGDIDAATPTQAMVLYRVVLEAVTNAVRHAQPTSVVVRVKRADDGRIAALVADDGKGFDAPAARQSLGVMGMFERCELAGGAFTIRSRPGRGTIVQARL